jgi:hypothetical protein
MLRISFILIMIVPGVGSADSVTQNFIDSMGEEAEISFITSSSVFGVAGIVFAIANHIQIDSDKKPSTLWLAGGYTVGGVNAALGGFYVVGASLLTRNAPGIKSWLWLGVSHIVVGGTSIALAIWGGSMPDENYPSVNVVPMIIPDSRGNAAFGIGLRLVDW